MSTSRGLRGSSRAALFAAVRCRYDPDPRHGIPAVAHTFRWTRSEEQRLHDLSKAWYTGKSKHQLQKAVVAVPPPQATAKALRACTTWQHISRTLASAPTAPPHNHPDPLCVAAAAAALPNALRTSPPATPNEHRRLTAFLDSFTRHAAAAVPALPPATAAALLHNLTRLPQPLPPLPCLPAAFGALLPTLLAAPPTATPHLLSAAAALRYPFTPTDLGHASAAATTHLPALSAPHAITILSALAPHRPPLPLLQHLCRHIFARLDGLPLPPLARLAAALITCAHHPGPLAVSTLASQLALLLTNPLRLAPPRRRSLRRGQRRPPRRTRPEDTPTYASSLGVLLTALAHLGHRPQPSWVQIVLAEACRLLACLAAAPGTPTHQAAGCAPASGTDSRGAGGSTSSIGASRRGDAADSAARRGSGGSGGARGSGGRAGAVVSDGGSLSGSRARDGTSSCASATVVTGGVGVGEGYGRQGAASGGGDWGTGSSGRGTSSSSSGEDAELGTLAAEAQRAVVELAGGLADMLEAAAAAALDGVWDQAGLGGGPPAGAQGASGGRAARGGVLVHVVGQGVEGAGMGAAGALEPLQQEVAAVAGALRGLVPRLGGEGRDAVVGRLLPRMEALVMESR